MDGKRRIALVATAAGASAAAGYAAMRVLQKPKASRKRMRKETNRTTARTTPHRKKEALKIEATTSSSRHPTRRTKMISAE